MYEYGWIMWMKEKKNVSTILEYLFFSFFLNPETIQYNFSIKV